MAKSPWIPLLLALLFVTLCFGMTLALPETLPIKVPTPKDAAVVVDPIDHHSRLLDHSIPEQSEDSASEYEIAGLKKWRHRVRETKELFAFVTRDATIAALVLTFLISRVGRHSINLLLQYASKRYNWSLSKVSSGFVLSMLLYLMYFYACLYVHIHLSNETSTTSRLASSCRYELQ